LPVVRGESIVAASSQNEKMIVRVVASHPWHKNKNVPGMGHPAGLGLDSTFLRG